MAEMTMFYTKGRNKGNERKITLLSPTGLIGKAPAKTKRIKLKARMPLSGEKTTGTPEWISAAYEFVSKNHDTVMPDVELSGFDIHFDDAQLFDKKGAKAVKCSMRGFVVEEVGDSENPDVVLTFTIYTPFSTRLWNWLGQMYGEDFWAKFDQVEEEEIAGDLVLAGETELEEDDTEDDE